MFPTYKKLIEHDTLPWNIRFGHRESEMSPTDILQSKHLDNYSRGRGFREGPSTITQVKKNKRIRPKLKGQNYLNLRPK